MTRDEAIKALAYRITAASDNWNAEPFIVEALRDFADAIAPVQPPMTVADAQRGPITVFGPRPGPYSGVG